MSKWLEYLALVPKGLRNPGQVKEGVINAVLFKHGKLPQDEMKEIQRRREICKTCPFFSPTAIANPALNYKSDRADDHCVCCGCPIETKTAALSTECGMGSCNSKFKLSNALKWEPYTKTNDQ